MERNRLRYSALIAIVIGAGLASRSSLADPLPEFIGVYAGDTLWALMAFLIIGLIFPRSRTLVVAVAALAFSFGVETSQLYQCDWINRIRATRPGALVLGSGFLWSDFICYTTGILMGVVGEVLGTRLRVAGSS